MQKVVTLWLLLRKSNGEGVVELQRIEVRSHGAWHNILGSLDFYSIKYFGCTDL